MSKKGKSITLIEDPRLEPYFITKDETCYTVNERIQPNSNHFRSKGGGKEYSKPQGYYASFERALIKISEEKLHTKGDFSSVDEFLEKFKQISNQIKSYTNEIRSAI
jgi:hypothetical protein